MSALYSPSTATIVLEPSDVLDGTHILPGKGKLWEIDVPSETKIREATILKTISRTYSLHPPSLITSIILVFIGVINIFGFLGFETYMLHPYVSLGILIVGIGILATMYVASK